jgi:uncharacterized lipoprotein YajG
LSPRNVSLNIERLTMKNLLVIAVCLSALGVMLTGCNRQPEVVEQPTPPTASKVDATGGEGRGGGMVGDFELDR